MSEMTRRERRNTLVDEAAEESFLDNQADQSGSKRKKKKKTLKESLAEIGKEVYNSEYREFLSRDAKGWFKLSLFYFTFYSCLAAFFVLLLIMFFHMIDHKKPSYYYKESVMNQKEVNPGMGFRPQVYIHDYLFFFNRVIF